MYTQKHTVLSVAALLCMWVCLSPTVQAANGQEWDVNSPRIQLYGQLRASVDNYSGDLAKPTQEGTGLNSNASRLGVKGAIPSSLGDVQVIYKAEIRYDTTNEVTTRQFNLRDGFAGLKSKTWGTLRLGRLSVGYKTTLTKIDPWNDNIPQSRAGGRQGSSEFHSSYFNSAVDYVSPKIAGGLTFNGWASIQPEQSTTPLHNTSTLKNYVGGTAGGVGAKYQAGNLLIGADYIKMDATTITTTGLQNGSGWQLGGRYKFGHFSVAALYEDVTNLGLGKNAYVNAIWKIGHTRLIAAYGQNRDSDVYGRKDWNNWSLGAKMDVTHKSELFLAYDSRSDATNSQSLNAVTVGINAKFGY